MRGNENGEIQYLLFPKRYVRLSMKRSWKNVQVCSLNDDGDILVSLQKKRILGKSQVHSIKPATSY